MKTTVQALGLLKAQGLFSKVWRHHLVGRAAFASGGPEGTSDDSLFRAEIRVVHSNLLDVDGFCSLNTVLLNWLVFDEGSDICAEGLGLTKSTNS